MTYYDSYKYLKRLNMKKFGIKFKQVQNLKEFLDEAKILGYLFYEIETK